MRPETAASLAAFLEAAIPDAADVFDEPAMAAANVYKAPWDREHVVDLIVSYARLYGRAADRGDCVLVVCD